jgi:hypothetical protein
MRRKGLFFIIFASFAFIAAQDTSFSGNYWITKPDNGYIVITGVSNTQSRKDKAVELALDDAAKRIALYYGIRGIVTNVIDAGIHPFDFTAFTNFEFDYDRDYQKYIDALIFDPEKDVFTTSGAVIVRVKYKPNIVPNIHYNSGFSDGKPLWTSKPPAAINGYIAGVGYANAHKEIKDTIEKSYQNAAAAIITNISSKISSSEIIVTGNTITTHTSTVLQISEGEMSEFLILETWIDPETKAVWTLAVAKKR